MSLHPDLEKLVNEKRRVYVGTWPLWLMTDADVAELCLAVVRAERERCAAVTICPDCKDAVEALPDPDWSVTP